MDMRVGAYQSSTVKYCQVHQIQSRSSMYQVGMSKDQIGLRRIGQQREIRPTDPPFVKSIRGGVGWPFYSFASLPVGLLLACLLPSKWAPTYQARCLYIQACLQCACIVGAQIVGPTQCSLWSVYCLCLVDGLLIACLSKYRTMAGLVCYLLACLPNKQAATNRACRTIASSPICRHRRGK